MRDDTASPGSGAAPERWPPHQKGQSLPGAGLFAMKIFIVALIIPFVVCIIGAWNMRAAAPDWLPPEAQVFPAVIWLSTALIVVTSFLAQRALGAIRHDAAPRCIRFLIATFVTAIVFTICQCVAWRQVYSAYDDLPNGLRVYRAIFYMLTGLHGVHVLGGLVWQYIVIARARRNVYWSLHHPGIQYAAIYWHFVDGVWLLLLAHFLLSATSRS